MQLSDIPDWSPRRFAQDATSGYQRTVPQTTSDPAAASFSLGFPPVTFTDESAGGSPPDGRDFNGILGFLSNWARWVGLGGPVPYNALVSGAGGYPKGARVQSATTAPRIWVSTVDNNTTNPDAGGAGWVSDVSVSYQDYYVAGTASVAVPAWATHAEIQIVGAGGGGGGSASGRCGGGGGAGAYVFGVTSVTPGSTITVVVGAGGVGGSAAGSDGGNSSFGGSVTAGGGLGGLSSTSSCAGGSGGSATAPNLRPLTGGIGADGQNFNTTVPGGSGAAGPFGGQGRSGSGGGVAGTAPGAGGGGAYNGFGSGGNGADGAVFIRWLL